MSANVSAIHVAELAARRSLERTMRGMIAVRAGRKKSEIDVMRKSSG